MNESYPFKLRLANLDKFIQSMELEKILREKLTGKFKCRKGPTTSHGSLAFQTERDRTDAFHILDGLEIGKSRVKTTIPIQRQFHTIKQPITDIRDRVTPLWKIPHPQQLELKQYRICSLMERYCKELKNLDKSSPIPDPKIYPFRSMENTRGYRNKCEFTIGRNRDGYPTVGFAMGEFKNGETSVESPRYCNHVNESTKKVVEYFEKFVVESGVDVYDRILKQGFWRLLMVRTFSCGDMMILVQVQRGVLDSDFEVKLIEHLVRHCVGFQFVDGRVHQIKSIHIQKTEMLSMGIDSNALYDTIHGPGVLTEEVAGFRFEISPVSFFQTNTQMIPILYSSIWELIDNGECFSSTILLDLCCGTGTIGIWLSRHFKQIFGIEMVSNAVEDGRRNSFLNGVSNVEWTCGKLEDHLKRVLDDVGDGPVVGVLDPPRSGVHKTVIQQIRAHEKLDRLIYVSCNPNGGFQNLMDLCRPRSKRYCGSAFRIVKVVPVDMFPDTDHYEAVVLLTRLAGVDRAL